MYRLYFVVICILFLWSCTHDTSYKISDQSAELTLVYPVSQKQLRSITEAFKEKGIKVDFSESILSANGTLKQLSMEVKFKSARGGTSTNYANLKDHPIGFKLTDINSPNPGLSIGAVGDEL